MLEMREENTALRVCGLTTCFHTGRGDLRAVDGVSFSIRKGEILGLVGESGCGKSVTSQSILRLYDEKREAGYSGEVWLGETELLSLPEKKMREIRGSRVSMIFQDALSSLNPVFTVGSQICEPLRVHHKLGRAAARARAVELLRLVGIPAPEQRFRQYPHELSGGMRQRVMIAIALACAPELLIADEPTTALDVTVQAQIMDLLAGLNRKLGMSVLLITHDLGVVAGVCDRVVVMYLGQIVEMAGRCELFDRPLHPYTWGLLQSIPRLDGDRSRPLHSIEGTVPLLDQVPQGCCRFAGRCPRAGAVCRARAPQLTEAAPGHWVRCWDPQEGGVSHVQP